uniref:Uncharacterized protein n=1 Tax=Pyxicephalus adspersus TaxID=30357 RepID=A0AAV2ZUH2_PYXAD|nr:TPA: hypothetical protein GDO54_003041 [Pyxicephalus adspersus]
MSETTTEPLSRRQRRRRRRKDQAEDLNNQFLSQVTELITTKEDELDMLGQTVACKLRKMREDQRLVAEYLINYTLYLGLMNRLENDEKPKPNCNFPEQFSASEQEQVNEAHNSDSSLGALVQSGGLEEEA